MTAKLTLPDGKVLTFEKGSKGVKNIFISPDKNCLVVVLEDEVLNYLNMPTELSYIRKEKDIEA